MSHHRARHRPHRKSVPETLPVAPPEPPAPPPPSSVVPAAIAQGWGARTWRAPQPLRRGKRVVNLGYWNLCEISYELQNAFLRYTSWPYLALNGGQSWVKERCQWLLDYDDPGHHEPFLLEDLLRMADVVHLNEYHSYPAIAQVSLVGKRMVIHHHGCAYRDNPDRYDGPETAAGYLRLISTPDLLTAGQPFYRKTKHWLPSPLNLEELDRNYPRWEPRDPKRPVQVLHAYTMKANKGTDEFERIAAGEMACGTNIEVGFIHRVQRRQSLWYMSQADIYFATFLFGPGAASYEAMAFGVPVLLGCTPDEREAQCEAIGCSRDQLPFWWVTPETCGKALRALAHDPDLRREWGRRGRRYVEKYHDLKPVARRLQKLYEQAEPAKAILYG